MAQPLPGNFFESHLRSTATLHRRGAKGIATALSLTQAMDRLLLSIYSPSRLADQKGVAVVALGGYGRKELNFASDIDVMILLADDDAKMLHAPAINDFFHRLLDQGIDVGHSVRTIAECVHFREQDPEVWISLLEARLIAGWWPTFAQFVRRFRKTFAGPSRSHFVQHILHLTDRRHDKYGHSVKLLEPNIKHSAGGLRDLHGVLWLLRGSSLLASGTLLPQKETAVIAALKSAKARRLFEKNLLQQTAHAFDFLLRVRNEMHLQSKGLHDTLEFSFQRQVAEGLRYRSTKSQTSVERFMRDYYIAARSVARLSRRSLAWARDQFASQGTKPPKTRINTLFLQRGENLDLQPRVRHLTNEILLRCFVETVERGLVFSPQLEARIERSASRLPPIRATPEATLFRRLLSGPGGVGRAFQQMNDLGLLARWIPEWEPLVAFFQHNIYHYYTADEHTLRVVSIAESLQSSPSSFGKVFRMLPRYDTLFLACLFHDIAKPRRLGDHEVGGVRVARRVLNRLGYRDVLEDVVFLVRHHLLMEQTAFRRNLSDPKTILDFAANFTSPHQLDYLYALTYADLSAVNKNVWTDWKESLLYDLYRKTREVLTRNLTEEQLRGQQKLSHREAIDSLARSLDPDISVEEALSHLDTIESDAYLTVFSKAEIAEHIRQIKRNGLISTLFRSTGDHTIVTIIARDAPYALSRFCGVLTANDANIIDANIFTRTDGIIIDKFSVWDYLSKSALSDDQCRKIRQELLDVFRGASDIEELLRLHKMKWKRRSRPLNPNIRTDVEFEDHPAYLIIDVYASDTLGFLYRISRAMSELGLDIAFAKIATRGDGIVDSFYVRDRRNISLPTGQRKEQIRRMLLQTIRDISASELTTPLMMS
jgi:[protein-PII] uridylyltransferase